MRLDGFLDEAALFIACESFRGGMLGGFILALFMGTCDSVDASAASSVRGERSFRGEPRGGEKRSVNTAEKKRK